MDRNDVFETYCDNNFRSVEGESGVRNLEQLCEVLGYGEGFMSGRALDEFLADNPGAVEAVLNSVGDWVERNGDWAAALEDANYEGDYDSEPDVSEQTEWADFDPAC